jgi:carbon-monoxide dehydrogenase medium subunit
MVPPLLCLDAVIELEGPDGRREAPMDGFLTGPGKTSMRPAEVLTRISLPAQPERSGSAFMKIMRRKALDLSIVAACARVVMAEDAETLLECRIGLGAVGPFPFRARRAEALLNGRRLDLDLLRAAAAEARCEARPITDVRASKEYRNELIETLVRRAVWTAARRSIKGAVET